MSAIILSTATHARIAGKIIELGWLDLKAETFGQRRYNPGSKITAEAMAQHHILDEDLENMPPSSTAALPEGTKYIIAHGVKDQIAVLESNGIDTSGIKQICALALARKAFPEFESHSLHALMFELFDHDLASERTLNPSAKNEVCMTRKVLVQVIEKLGVGLHPEFLFIASENARVPTYMPLGDYAGWKMCDIPKDYIDWALNNLRGIDSYLTKALLSQQRAISRPA